MSGQRMVAGGESDVAGITESFRNPAPASEVKRDREWLVVASLLPESGYAEMIA